MAAALRAEVYNLEFPSWIDEFTIGGYRFTRMDDYKSRLARLQHLFRVTAEFTCSPNNGEHVVTAHVGGPAGAKSVIFADNAGKTALDDVLLLLSLFTQRDVFAVPPNTEGVVLADPRLQFSYAGILRCSIPYKAAGPGKHGDVGLPEALDNMFTMLQNPVWQQKYDKGHFLALALQAFKRQPLETTFTQCWTIWEHLFAAMNRAWLSDKAVGQIAAHEKISFILHAFALRANREETDHERIGALAEIRNRLVHYGRLPERDGVHSDAVLFCQVTEFVIAKILGLGPSDLFNTLRRFQAFLKSTQTSSRQQAPREPSGTRGPGKKRNQRHGSN